MKTVIIRAHFLRLRRKKPGFSGVPPSRLQAVKIRPEKLQSNFVSVFTQNGRSRPFNPIAPRGLKKMVSFWNRLNR
jgi:hypothetical protein